MGRGQEDPGAERETEYRGGGSREPGGGRAAALRPAPLHAPRPSIASRRRPFLSPPTSRERGRRSGRRRRGDRRGAQSPSRPRGDGGGGPGVRPAPPGPGTSRPPRAEGRAHWPARLRAPRPLAGRREEHAATVAGAQSEGGGLADGPRAARAARGGHGGCGAAGGRSALAAVQGPRRAASLLVLALLPRLRPPGSRRPLPWRPALRARPGARRRRRTQRAPVGALPGHAETGARWVSRSGTGAGGVSARRQARDRATDRPAVPSRPGRRSSGKAPWWGSPGPRRPKARQLFGRGSSGSSRGPLGPPRRPEAGGPTGRFVPWLRLQELGDPEAASGMRSPHRLSW